MGRYTPQHLLSEAAMSGSVRYDHLRTTRPELHDSLAAVDASLGLNTPGELTESDQREADRRVPGLSRLLLGSIGNASALSPEVTLRPKAPAVETSEARAIKAARDAVDEAI